MYPLGAGETKLPCLDGTETEGELGIFDSICTEPAPTRGYTNLTNAVNRWRESNPGVADGLGG
jgi:hypothetical protein